MRHPDSAAVPPSDRLSTAPVRLDVIIAVHRRLFVLSKEFAAGYQDIEDESLRQGIGWSMVTELAVPEAVYTMQWLTASHVLLGFAREYTVMNLDTGGVMDVTAISPSCVPVMARLRMPPNPLTESAANLTLSRSTSGLASGILPPITPAHTGGAASAPVPPPVFSPPAFNRLKSGPRWKDLHAPTGLSLIHI